MTISEKRVGDSTVRPRIISSKYENLLPRWPRGAIEDERCRNRRRGREVESERGCQLERGNILVTQSMRENPGMDNAEWEGQ